MNFDEIVRLRKLLHTNPEVSGSEEITAELILTSLKKSKPYRIVDNIAGNGLAVIYSSRKAGPTVLFRCELDALPIPETVKLKYGSKCEGVSHKCGHDGHMAIMVGLADTIAKNRPECGNVVLLFQPSEETGEGAALVLKDKNFIKNIPKPDYVFALHNLPGFPVGHVIVREETFASASIGLSVDLIGATSHASEPQNGRSPALALAQIIQGLSSIPQFNKALHETGQVTIIHARLGEEAFGTSPGLAKVMATLRSHSSKVLENLKKTVNGLL
ncbi:amidohydrolase [bacterium]|nr:amidohydrolase [bacterium]